MATPADTVGHGWPHAGRLAWPGMTSVYAALPPHADETRTGPGQVGVSFSAHRDVVYRSHARTARATYAGGSVICSGGDEIVWNEVREATEALEIYPDPDLLRALGAPDHAHPWPVERTAVGLVDPVVLGVASTLRRTHVVGAYLSETASSTLAHLLAGHVLRAYGGSADAPEERPSRLSGTALGRVHDLVESELAGDLTLDRLSAAVHLSPFHFARCFAATVGMPPHRFVTSRRIDHARHLLRSSPWPVERVACAVGFGNLSHFRRVFRVHVGLTPAAYRAATRSPVTRPGAAPARPARGARSRSSR